MKNKKIKTGDVFRVQIDKNLFNFFQYVGNDKTQLDSEVIRVFKLSFEQKDINIEEIVSSQVDFYAHVFLKLGKKLTY